MYSSDKNANIVINKIRDGFATMSEWFMKNTWILTQISTIS